MPACTLLILIMISLYNIYATLQRLQVLFYNCFHDTIGRAPPPILGLFFAGRLWTFDVLVCPLSATERFLLQPLVCGTVLVFHRTVARHCCPLLSPSSAVVLNHISSHFLIPLSDSSLICIQCQRSDSSFWTL